MSILVFIEGFDIKLAFSWHIRNCLLTFFALSVERTECGRSTWWVNLFVFKIKTATRYWQSDISSDSACSRRQRAVNPVQVVACVCETSRPCCKFNTGSRLWLLHHRWVVSPKNISSTCAFADAGAKEAQPHRSEGKRKEKGDFPVSGCLQRIFICSVCAHHELSMIAK